MSTLHWYERTFFKTLIRERQVRFGFVVTSLVLIFALVGTVLAVSYTHLTLPTKRIV